MDNAITEVESTLEGTNSRITEAEDRISEVKDRMVKTNEAEEKKRKDLKEMRNPRSGRLIIGIPEEERP